MGVDGDHAHFLVQSVPSYSPTRIVQTVKSVTAREMFAKVAEVKRKLWGGEFWATDISSIRSASMGVKRSLPNM
jgi:REP element-mobilizing transposase RayT